MTSTSLQRLTCFKAYDIRGKVPDELNEDLAYEIGTAYAIEFMPRSVVLGYDIRLESKKIAEAVEQGLLNQGVDVLNIGLCGTEEIYFATPHYHADGGIMITASHNPKGYCGMKLVKKHSIPISKDSGLDEMKNLILEKNFPDSSVKGLSKDNFDKTFYLEHMLSYVDKKKLLPLKIVMNAGNGSAGSVIRLLSKSLPFECIFLNEEPDGNFPNGVPNPLLMENRIQTSEAVVKYKADLGIAWDGDFDRCFFFDEKGDFIEGYYIVGLLSEAFLKKSLSEKIVHDPRLIWNTIDIVDRAGGTPIQSKTGHAFIKDRMRAEDAIYGGEMSAHHYFRDFHYCDSGMIPWLLVTELMSVNQASLSALVQNKIEKFPCSGEINYQVFNSEQAIKDIFSYFEGKSISVSYIDGLSMEFPLWRMNIRVSNTEPLLRLNIESKGDYELVSQKVSEVAFLLQKYIKEPVLSVCV